jgi:small subunit ribosomal protein S13
MLYFLQTGIPENKRLDKGLLAVYGVGNKTALNVCLQFGLLNGAKGKDLRRLHRYQLKSHFDDYPLILGEELKQNYKSNTQRLIDIISYRGRRHKGGYPVRGQRTHTNARTQKRLYKRWLINTYEKPKLIINNKKISQNIKAKKSKVAKPKTSNKAKATKISKYKI